MPRSRSPKRGRNVRSAGKVKLVKIVKSPKADKKLMAVFSDGKNVHFGARGYSDFTIHKDTARRQRYESRHRSRENWKDFRSPGALSKWVLWNKPSLQASIADYKRKFNL